MHGKTGGLSVARDAGKSVEWLVRRGIVAGKTQRCLRTQPAAIAFSLNFEDRYKFVVPLDLDL